MYMTVKDAMKVLDVSRTTMMAWLEGERFSGAYKLTEFTTAPWYIPADSVEAVRQELIADLERQIRRISVPVTDRFDVDFVSAGD